jgi:hypothetical protein
MEKKRIVLGKIIAWCVCVNEIKKCDENIKYIKPDF